MNYVESNPNSKFYWVLAMIIVFTFGLFVGYFDTSRYYKTRTSK